ncbi:hypothetical protein U1Q18_032327 [Sarracenia purpurea var. burkii]
MLSSPSQNRERNEGTEEGEDGKMKVGTPSACSSTGDGERGMQERKRKPPLLAIVAPTLLVSVIVDDLGADFWVLASG